VWIDELWYWKNVRPLLRNPKQRCGVLIYGIFGSTLTIAEIFHHNDSYVARHFVTESVKDGFDDIW